MNTIERLQQWYLSMCNGDWEHNYGIKVDNLDNPGWRVTIDLTDTDLEGEPFPAVEYGVGEEAIPDDNNWMCCKIEGNTFRGAGGPEKLEEILKCFLDWDDTINDKKNGTSR